MRNLIHIFLFFSLSLVLHGCIDLAADCSNIPGKYYDIDDSTFNHYVELYKDGTFLHYCKREGHEYSHTGKWWEGRKNCMIELDGWEIYGQPLLRQLDGFNNAEFGSGMGNLMFWPTRKFLRIHPDGTNGFVKEKYAKDYFEEEEEERIADSIYWATKDTLFYNTGEIEAIGKLVKRQKYTQEGKVDVLHREGEWKEYYKNGQLKAIGVGGDNKKYGKKRGIWKFYDEKGNIDSLGGYTGGLSIGPWEYYHKNGKLREIGVYIYISGKYYKRDDWKVYNKEGKLIKVKKYPIREHSIDSLYRVEGYKPEFIEKNVKERIEYADEYYKEYKALKVKQDSIATLEK